MTEFSGGDFDGFDYASESAIHTDIFDNVHSDLPDPIDGADASGPAFDDPDVSGESAIDALPADELIVASDGTAYEGYGDFVVGADTRTAELTRRQRVRRARRGGAMYEWVEALAYELEAAGRPAAASQREKLADSYVRGMARLGGTKAGESLGEWVRSFGAVVSQVPVLSWQADLVAARQGTDHLMRQVKLLPADDPQAGIAAIQVVEALDAVRRERLAIRAAMLLVNPVSTTAAVALNTAGQIGKADLARPRLLRRGHAIAARNHGADAQFFDVHALARAYLAGGKPKHALRFAVDAAQLARRAANAAPTAQVGRSSVLTQLRSGAGEGVVGAVGAARQAAREALAPTYSQFPPAEQWRRRCGAALVTASWAHLAMNQRDRASEAAAAAVRLGNTMGYVPQAAALPATGSSARQRLELLRKVDGCDRREYSGTARGDGGTAWNLTSLQTKKAVKLADEAESIATGRRRGRGAEPAPRRKHWGRRSHQADRGR